MTFANKIKIYPRKRIEDHRGWFLKTIHGNEDFIPSQTGETYVTVAYPGEMKGGHYHLIANEWFTLIMGKCTLKLVDIATFEKYEIILDAQSPVTIFVPSGIAHAFYNDEYQGTQNFVLLAYTSCLFDPKDTIIYNFNEIKSSHL